jgi:hypothetical protein
MMPDPDYRIVTYESLNADPGKEWLARVQHPRTTLHIFFEAPTEAEVITKATDFWEERRKEREEAWARKDAARAAAEARKAELVGAA